MPQPNSGITQALTAAIANYAPQLADDVTANIPLLTWLKKRGNTRTFDGGVEIYENVLFGEVAAQGWYSGAEVLSTADSDVMTTANYAFKQFYANVTLSGRETIENAGKSRKHDLLNGKLEAAEATMTNNIGAALFYSNTENGGKAIGGLQHLVSDSPSSPTVGGIVASDASNAFWRNYVFDFSANSLTAGASTILTALNTSFLNTNRGNEKVDLVLGGTTYFQYFESSLQANQRFTDAEMGQAGFSNYKYKSAVVLHDPNCSATRMYGLNTKYIFFRPFESRNFTQGDRKPSLNQDLFVIPMYWAGNMTASSRQRHFVIIA
jgi:hypothetical protein